MLFNRRRKELNNPSTNQTGAQQQATASSAQESTPPAVQTEETSFPDPDPKVKYSSFEQVHERALAAIRKDVSDSLANRVQTEGQDCKEVVQSPAEWAIVAHEIAPSGWLLSYWPINANEGRTKPWICIEPSQK